MRRLADLVYVEPTSLSGRTTELVNSCGCRARSLPDLHWRAGREIEHVLADVLPAGKVAEIRTAGPPNVAYWNGQLPAG